MEIVPHVHLVRDSMVNLYLLDADDGISLIDAGLDRNARRILEAIKAIGRTPQDLRQVFITHCDGDHVGGVAALKRQSPARVYASPAEAEAMAAGKASRPIGEGTLVGRLFAMFNFLFAFQSSRADEYLSDGQVFPVLGGLHILATPGHTPEHMSLYLPSAGILFSGDSILSRGNRLQVTHGATTWDEEKALESMRKQAALHPRIVCTGHGPVIMDAAGKFPVQP